MTGLKPLSSKRIRRQRGNNILEFALFSIFLVPAFMGTVSTGLGLSKAIQTATVARDAGHMFVRQVDFSQPQNKALIVRLSTGLGMTVGGGNGVVILTQILMIGPDECAAGGLSSAQCTNLGWPVITQRLVIGNPGLLSSTIGTPSPSLLQTDGTITSTNYLKEMSCRANTVSHTGYTGLLNLLPAERAYASEAYFVAPELAFLNNGNSIKLYSRNYF